MMTTIVDGQGRERSDLAPDLADLAVKDMGCVALRPYGSRALEIRCRPDRIRPKALLKAVDLLERKAWDHHVLSSWVDGQWHSKIIGNYLAAIERLTEMAGQVQSKRRRDFLSRRLAAAAVAEDAAFGPIQHAWRTARGVKGQKLMEAVREASCGRYLEVAPHGGAERLVLVGVGVGEGYSLYGRGWRSMAIGGRFEDMPDYEYAQWASQAYRESFRSGQPIFEEVSAVVNLLRSGRLLLEYRRVILPIGPADRPAGFLGATLGQKVTRLGLEPGHEGGHVVQ